nr:hypothetical protein [Nanoarchaeum sp.]
MTSVYKQDGIKLIGHLFGLNPVKRSIARYQNSRSKPFVTDYQVLKFLPEEFVYSKNPDITAGLALAIAESERQNFLALFIPPGTGRERQTSKENLEEQLVRPVVSFFVHEPTYAEIYRKIILGDLNTLAACGGKYVNPHPDMDLAQIRRVFSYFGRVINDIDEINHYLEKYTREGRVWIENLRIKGYDKRIDISGKVCGHIKACHRVSVNDVWEPSKTEKTKFKIDYPLI